MRRTPIVRPGPGSFGVDVELVLKLECLQHTGSFKPRGAFNTVLSADVGPAGVVAASGGNHGAAVAFVARALGMRAEVFVPELCPQVKRQRIAQLGATVTVGGAIYDDAQVAATQRAGDTGALLVHPYDAVTTVAGQATCGRELAEDMPDVDVVVVAVGGGGFAAGIAIGFPPPARLVTVEPDTSACLHAALAAGRPVEVEVSGLAADSLGTRRVGEVPWTVLRDRVDTSVTVPDGAIAAAQRALWQELRLVVEPGGAAALAGLMAGAVPVAPTDRVAVLVCGSNTDPATVAGPAPAR